MGRSVLRRFCPFQYSHFGIGPFLHESAFWLLLGLFSSLGTVAGAQEKLVFASERDGNGEIYTANEDGSNQVNVTNHPGKDGTPSWSPDQQQIVFSSQRTGHWDIYVMNADGSNPVNLTNDFYNDGWPMWSPSGDRILFLSNRDSEGDSYSQLYLTNPDGSNLEFIYSAGPVQHAAWHPDGRSIVYSDTNGDLWSLNILTQETTRLTEGDWDDDYPSWSPDGTSLMFASDRISKNSRKLDLFLLNPTTKSITKLFGSKATDERYPGWMPDGRVVFSQGTNYDAKNTEIYITRDDVRNRRKVRVKQLTRNRAIDNHPVARPVFLIDSVSPSATVTDREAEFVFPIEPQEGYAWCPGGLQYTWNVQIDFVPDGPESYYGYEFGFYLFTPMGAGPCGVGDFETLLSVGQFSFWAVAEDGADILPQVNVEHAIRADGKQLVIRLTDRDRIGDLLRERPQYVIFNVTIQEVSTSENVLVVYR